MKKGIKDPELEKKEKEAEKKDRRRKKEKEKDGLKVVIGVDVDVEGPKVIIRPPKRGGCTSSGSLGLVGPKLKLKPTIDIEPKDRKKKKKKKIVVKRPVKEDDKVTDRNASNRRD